MPKTLYLSDLDGTLLRPDARLSNFAIKTINNLVKSGGYFSYATARSLVTASAVTIGLDADFPVICYNGAFVFGNKSKNILLSHYFTGEEITFVMDVMEQNNFTPIVYSFINGVEHFSFISRNNSTGVQKFLNARQNDPRRREVTSADELFSGNVFYIACIDDYDRLLPINGVLTPDVRIYGIFHKDVYTGDWWGEYLPAKATKATAAAKLKKMLGCDKLIVFGDGLNDIPLFEAADEAYAMANAVSELKEIATAVIGSNADDGVAKWLIKNLGIL
ncbi:MAG: HAD family hydrolase [Defluviitaleaceae bacterium]|nr:HAD family hydrolase [Defluviitaleaceae bacterium]